MTINTKKFALFSLLLLIVICNHISAAQLENVLAEQKEEYAFVPCANGKRLEVNPQKLALYKKIKYKTPYAKSAEEKSCSYQCLDLDDGTSQINLTGFARPCFISGRRYCLQDRVIGVDSHACHSVIMVPNVQKHECMIEHSWDQNNQNFIKIIISIARGTATEESDQTQVSVFDVDNTVRMRDLFIYLTKSKGKQPQTFLHFVDLENGCQMIAQLRKSNDYEIKPDGSILNKMHEDIVHDVSTLKTQYVKELEEEKTEFELEIMADKGVIVEIPNSELPDDSLSLYTCIMQLENRCFQEKPCLGFSGVMSVMSVILLALHFTNHI